MKKLKIAFIGLKGIPAKWGGMEKYVEEIGKRLAQRGHEVTVYGSKWYCPGSGRGDYLGMKVHAMPTLHFQPTDALTNAFCSLVRILPAKYDIVHCHGYASYYFIPILKFFGKKSVVTAHGVESGWDNPKYSSLARVILRRAYETGIKNADGVTTVADHLRARIYKMFRFFADVMPSGFDEVTSRPAQIISDKYGLKGQDYVLFLGRIDPIKRADWLLDFKTITGSDIKIVIAGGPQDSSTRVYYDSIIKRASGNSQIILTGPVIGDEKAELLSNCICMMAPSQYEGLPITVLEAAAYGRCCFASDIPAHKEIIEDGVNGFLFASQSKQAFLDGMKKIISSSADSLSAIGYQAKRTALNKFNWDITTDKFESLYFRILFGGRNK